jgi:hypothetical protein
MRRHPQGRTGAGEWEAVQAGHTLFAVSVPFCEPSKNKIILSAGFQYNYHSK